MKSVSLSASARRCRAVTSAALIGASMGLMSACSSLPSERLSIDTRYHSQVQDSRVRYIVIHFTDENFDSALHILTKTGVSSHYLVDADPPTIYRLVDESRRAAHAGVSFWKGERMLNSSSIGIEIVNLGDRDDTVQDFEPYPDRQIDAVIKLVRDIARRHAVPPHRIVGHNDIAPQRKTDPGPRFPWHRLFEEGLIPWPDSALVAAARPSYEQQLPSIDWFQRKLAEHGYEIETHGRLDEATRRVIAVFQMKYRPARFDGLPDAETAALLDVITRADGLRLRDSRGQAQIYKP